MLLVMGLVGLSRRPERKMTVNTVRIRRPDGTMREALLEGDLRGSGLSIGDDVSFWGSDRSGVLVVKQAYNHTVSGQIRIHPPTPPWIARIVVAFVILFILMILLSMITSSYHTY